MEYISVATRTIYQSNYKSDIFTMGANVNLIRDPPSPGAHMCKARIHNTPPPNCSPQPGIFQITCIYVGIEPISFYNMGCTFNRASLWLFYRPLNAVCLNVFSHLGVNLFHWFSLVYYMYECMNVWMCEYMNDFNLFHSTYLEINDFSHLGVNLFHRFSLAK